MGFNGDTSLPFQIHGIKKLIFHVSLAHRICALHQPITQGGFPMINMRNNAEISNFRWIHLNAYKAGENTCLRRRLKQILLSGLFCDRLALIQ